ncbi:N-alpha-acetyltransferase 60-like, partial [Scleropages formosus]
FPIEYPHSWYDITSNKKFFSLAATSRGVIVGKIVAEIEDRTKVYKEDGEILTSSFPVNTQVAYILSLGMVKEFRKCRIGSFLLDSLKYHISITVQNHCKPSTAFSSSWTIFDYIQHIGSMLASLRLCSIPQSIFRQAL